MNDIFYQSFSTFVGAVLAFAFGWVLYLIQKRQENFVYLHYAISTMGHLNNRLYLFKEQVQKRYEEVKEQRTIFEKAIKNNIPPHLQLRETSNQIYGAEFSLTLDLEKLSFLVKREPNLIIILGTLIDSIKSLNYIVADINSDLKQYSLQMIEINPRSMFFLLRQNELLYEQTDSSLYLAEKIYGLLLQFGKLEYKKRMIIKSIGFTDKKFENLKPEPIKSWENDYKWFSKKKPWWKTL